ncbi:hypothetical protein STRIC_2319 [Streptococcus ictaluri 707-05]|uniref:ABC transporter domain-containing protein n=1 Tax=Streptococcus ictaluri 707-05 TaxID=764299 RepID=G5K1R1_9STRE|nr:hypothetical protein STRIC_2319 [Streptococcus ictaluri 707-05]
MEKLIVNNVSLNLGDIAFLKDFNFELNKGESLTIIGESGSGKTLLTKLLLG